MSTQLVDIKNEIIRAYGLVNAWRFGDRGVLREHGRPTPLPTYPALVISLSSC